MTRVGCAQEAVQQSQFSPGPVEDNEPIILVTSTAELTLQSFPNGKLKSGELSVCRGALCRLEEMIAAVVGDPSAPKMVYTGYVWALAAEIRSILAKRNTSRDKAPNLTPKKAGAFCVVDDGEPSYKAHACIAYSQHTSSFWALHDSVAARGDLLIAFQARGLSKASASPPFSGGAPQIAATSS